MGVNSCGTTLIDNGTFKNIGAISWDTTVKTAGFTAVAGNGYFVNTTSGQITVTLPSSPTAGDAVAIADYANTADTNNIIIDPNGNNIQGSASNFNLNTEGGTILLIYVDATKGWLSIDSAVASDISEAASFITATGGTITTSGDYKIHTFTGPGTFTVCSVGNPLGSDSVDYVVLAGGGGGGYQRGGGGGAGGYREGYNPGSYTASPLATSALPVTATGYPITVGGGGTGGTYPTTASTNGSPSTFSCITATGGGHGGDAICSQNAAPGGSGGGGKGASGNPSNAGGTGNTPPVSPPQGNNGGAGSPSAFYGAGGGGGAGAAGTAGSGPTSGPGGNGVTSSINASPVTRAGGGGGSHFTPCGSSGTGGTGGGGNGATAAVNAGTGGTNLGGGGGGGAFTNTTCSAPTDQGANGGSGIVIIRYKFQ